MNLNSYTKNEKKRTKRICLFSDCCHILPANQSHLLSHEVSTLFPYSTPFLWLPYDFIPISFVLFLSSLPLLLFLSFWCCCCRCYMILNGSREKKRWHCFQIFLEEEYIYIISKSVEEYGEQTISERRRWWWRKKKSCSVFLHFLPFLFCCHFTKYIAFFFFFTFHLSFNFLFLLFSKFHWTLFSHKSFFRLQSMERRKWKLWGYLLFVYLFILLFFAFNVTSFFFRCKF